MLPNSALLTGQAMNRFICAVLVLCFTACSHVPSESSKLPTEVDTIVLSRKAVLSNVSGAIFRKAAEELASVVDGEHIEPGEMLLVRRGASFSIGNTTFGPEFHGDRWVRFQ